MASAGLVGRVGMERVKASCKQCSAALRVPAVAGKRVRCPKCGEVFSISLDDRPDTPQKTPIADPADKTEVRSKICSLAEVPNTIGPYQIRRVIGRGGMGQVFEAEQSEPIQRLVALKVINTVAPSPELIDRFQGERQALAIMEHPNIARVYDAGITHEQRPYFTMELIDGYSITGYCDNNRLNTPDRLRLFVQACRAIQHAHQKQVIHRDLKPSNVLVTAYDGKPTVKVIDFGLAKGLAESLSRPDEAGYHTTVVGTPTYMSPEQAIATGKPVDTKTDVYSLGIILFELLTGSTPISIELVQTDFSKVINKITTEDAPRPSDRLSEAGDSATSICEHRATTLAKLRGELTTDLDWIVVKALQRLPEDRYASVSELADDVERYLSRHPISARPNTIGYQLGKFASRHKGVVAGAAAVIASMIAGITFTTYFALREMDEAERAKLARSRTENLLGENERLLAAETAAKEHARGLLDENRRARAATMRREYAATIRLANFRIDEGNFPAAYDLLQSTAPELRGFEYGHSMLMMDQSQRVIETPGRCRDLAISQDGQRVAAILPDGLFVWKTDSDEPPLRVQLPANTRVVFGNDNESLYCLIPAGKRTRLQAWRLSEKPESTLDIPISPAAGLAVRPHSDQLTVWEGRTVRIMTARGVVLKEEEFSASVSRVYYSGDGRNAVVQTGMGTSLVIFSKANQRTILDSDDREADQTSLVSFSTDGDKCTLWTRNNRSWTTRTDAIRKASRYDPAATYQPVPTNQFVPFYRYNVMSVFASSGIAVLENKTQLRVAAELPIDLAGHSGPVRFAVRAIQAGLIASAADDNTIRIWNPRAVSDTRIVAAPEGETVVAVFPNTGETVSLSDQGLRIMAPNGVAIGRPIGLSLAGGPGDWRLALDSKRRLLLCGSRIEKKVLAIDLRAATSRSIPAIRWMLSGDTPVEAISVGTDKCAIGWQAKPASIHSLEDGKSLGTLGTDETVSPLVLSKSDSLLMGYVATQFSTHIWDLSTLSDACEPRMFAGDESIQCLAADPSGPRFVSGSSDGTIRLWSARGEQAFFNGQQGNIDAACFSPDGSRLVTNACGGLRFWDLDTGLELLNRRTAAGCAATELQMSPDGSVLYAQTSKGVQLWDSARVADVVPPSTGIFYVLDGNDPHRFYSSSLYPRIDKNATSENVELSIGRTVLEQLTYTYTVQVPVTERLPDGESRTRMVEEQRQGIRNVQRQTFEPVSVTLAAPVITRTRPTSGNDWTQMMRYFYVYDAEDPRHYYKTLERPLITVSGDSSTVRITLSRLFYENQTQTYDVTVPIEVAENGKPKTVFEQRTFTRQVTIPVRRDGSVQVKMQAPQIVRVRPSVGTDWTKKIQPFTLSSGSQPALDAPAPPPAPPASEDSTPPPAVPPASAAKADPGKGR